MKSTIFASVVVFLSTILVLGGTADAAEDQPLQWIGASSLQNLQMELGSGRSGSIEELLDIPEWHAYSNVFYWAAQAEGTIQVDGAYGRPNTNLSDVRDDNNFGWGIDGTLRYGRIQGFFTYSDTRVDDERGGKDISLRVRTAEAEYGYRNYIGDSVITPFIGIRMIYIHADIDTAAPGRSGESHTEIDPVLGGEWLWLASDCWYTVVRADFAGFGAGTDFTGSWNARIGFNVCENGTIEFGYRLMDIKYEQGDRANDLDVDFVLDGFVAAVGFSF